MSRIPCYFHDEQLAFKPVYEWAMGQRIDHPETTARAENILAALKANDRFEVLSPAAQPIDAIRAVHSYELLTLYNTAKGLPEGETFYPSVFPRELREIGDPTNLRHAGCYCFDSGTPLNAMTFDAAAWSAACAWEAAGRLADGMEERKDPVVYALSRPPGHHATEQYFGGYSYFNNCVIAAKRLGEHGRVAVVDIDFHHGNGTQSIFYGSGDVLFASIHGDPLEAYPHYIGYADERGRGPGAGANLNLPLPPGTPWGPWAEALDTALAWIGESGAEALVLSLGVDAYVDDPISFFRLQSDHFREAGARIGRAGLPTVVCFEGGYAIEAVGINAVNVLEGMTGTG